MNTAPDELYEGEYKERLDRINLVATGTPPPTVKDGEMAILRTPNGLFPAEVEQTPDDNTILIYFWNGQTGRVDPLKQRLLSTLHTWSLQQSSRKCTRIRRALSSQYDQNGTLLLYRMLSVNRSCRRSGVESSIYRSPRSQQLVTEFLKPKTSKGKKQKK
jgi:hypothetical protein